VLALVLDVAGDKAASTPVLAVAVVLAFIAVAKRRR